MRAVILAGGKGTRLKPYTTVLPKPLMPVGGVPMLEILIRQLALHGCTHVTITLGYLGKLIRMYFSDGEQFGLKIDYSEEPRPLGTMGPLKLIPDLPEDFLVLNGDVLTDLSFSEFFRKHRESHSLFSISSYKREIDSDFGVLEVNAGGRLVGFKEKPKIPFEVSMGVYAANRAILEDIPVDKPFGFDNLMLQLLSHGRSPNVFTHSGLWLDIGRSDDFERAQDAFERLHKTVFPNPA